MIKNIKCDALKPRKLLLVAMLNSMKDLFLPKNARRQNAYEKVEYEISGSPIQLKDSNADKLAERRC